MAKTKPIGVRFDEEIKKKMKEAKIAESSQKQVNYFEQLFLDTHDAAMGRIKINGVIPKEKEQDMPTSPSAEEIQKQIEVKEKELKNPPKEPSIGLRNWQRVREKEIAELKKQLK